MLDWKEGLINAKYHLRVVERMFESYENFPDKRFLIGIIRELEKAVFNLVLAYLVFGGSKISKNIKSNSDIFRKDIGLRYLDRTVVDNILMIFKIGKDQRKSPIEYSKEGNLIFLIGGEYKFLRIERLKDLINSVKIGISNFPKIPKNFRQV